MVVVKVHFFCIYFLNMICWKFTFLIELLWHPCWSWFSICSHICGSVSQVPKRCLYKMANTYMKKNSIFSYQGNVNQNHIEISISPWSECLSLRTLKAGSSEMAGEHGTLIHCWWQLSEKGHCGNQKGVSQNTKNRNTVWSNLYHSQGCTQREPIYTVARKQEEGAGVPRSLWKHPSSDIRTLHKIPHLKAPLYPSNTTQGIKPFTHGPWKDIEHLAVTFLTT